MAPRLPKPVLWWSSHEDGSGVVNAVLTNKMVWLNERGVRQHTPFQIRRRNLLTRIPRLGQRLFGAWVGDVPTVYQGAGAMRSETHWQATNVSLVPSAVDYFFIDGNGGISGSLAVSNTPTFQWRSVKHGGGVLNPKLGVDLSPYGLAPGSVRAELAYIRKEYEFTFEGFVLAPQDPAVEIEVLAPGTSEDLLRDVAFDVLDHELGDLAFNQEPLDPELRNLAFSQGPLDPEGLFRITRFDRYLHDPYLASALRHVDSFLGRRYAEFTIHGETRFIATTDEPHPVSLTVRGDGPVRLLFAIQVRDRDTGTTSISEFMPVVVRESRSG